MNTLSVPSDTKREAFWKTYLKAMAFVLPAIIGWGFACVYLVPKLKEICSAAKLNPAQLGWVWNTPFFLAHFGRSILMAVLVILVALELLGRKRPQPRRTVVGIAVWFVNVVVLYGSITLLTLSVIAAAELIPR